MGLATLVTALVLQAHAMHAPAVQVKPVWPAEGTITTQFVASGSARHPGIDIGTLRSLDVRAAVAGRVLVVGQPTGYEGYGNVVVVQSRRGYEELYAHLSSFDVRPGEKLTPGREIGVAGCTGWCTGTHLHFEVRHQGVAVSPLTTVLRPLVDPVVHRAPVRLLAAAKPLR
ncbi:MAG TPA: M23 family metallopeptidase [Gaiellaceae bacterium]|jgi:murein DD-endopeptidase MepM/ murein hydrolase activator NlpD|nr:M23 family metallopeptidase [Gaiellaceae bacterium]